MVRLKSLKSLRTLNHGFSGIVCFQGLKRHFVSPFSPAPHFRSDIPAFGGNDKASSRDTSEPLFRDEWSSLFDHPHHSTNFLEEENYPILS
jgi:hypothetical protein